MLSANQDTLILCPTKRFARGLQHHEARQAFVSGQQAVQALNIQTLDQWLSAQTDQAYLTNRISPPPHRLSAFEERLLWQRVIKRDLSRTNYSDLFDVRGLANNCIEAHRYMVAWSLKLQTAHLNDECRAFLRWQAAFTKECEQLESLESVRYMDWQLAALEQGAFALPSRILFAGFDQTAPQELRLRQILSAQGVNVDSLHNVEEPATAITHLPVQDEKQEIQSMIGWLLQVREQNPGARIALVVPQLQNIREQITDALDASLQASTFDPEHVSSPREYNVSLGEPLSQQPMIAAALNLLKLLFRRDFDQSELSSLLLSPFWSASLSESDARAILEARMRERLPSRIRWVAVLKAIDDYLPQNVTLSRLKADLSAALGIVSEAKTKQQASAWKETFKRTLEALNWPGERVESSHEFQTHDAWDDCLNTFASLVSLADRMSSHEALHMVSQLANEQVFQPETTGEPAIQVLGIMEALSAPVDAMWVMGMNDNQWPLPARPNPLLPAALQREAGVANADDHVQMAFAQSVHKRLLYSAKTIVFSSSEAEGDKELRASPLMEGVALHEATHAIWQPLHVSLVSELNSHAWTWIEDHNAPEVKAGEHVKGGTSLIQAQSICPAWAFYQYRLGARALETPKQGFDAADRGELVHNALESFWKKAGTPRHYIDLVQMSQETREMAITESIASSIDHFKTNQGAEYSPQMWDLEAARMQRLINEWLEYELARAVNFKIIDCEVAYTTEIQGIEVKLKIDRIHALPENGLEIVDYKTGAIPNMDSWGTTRMTNPQLPIYASYYVSEQPIVGVQFGMVKTKSHAFVGVSETNFDDEVGKRKPKFINDFDDWDALKQQWQQSIDGIALEIKAGEASVRFENMDDLRYCDVLPILRLQERAMQFEMVEPTTESEA